MLPASRRDVLAIAAALLLVSRPARADPIGSVTKLPLPRFASLKTDRGCVLSNVHKFAGAFYSRKD